MEPIKVRHSPIARFIDAVETGDERTCEEAFEALLSDSQGIENDLEVRPFLDALAHPDVNVRQAVSAVLGEIPISSSELTGCITRALADHDSTVRGNAAMALGKLGDAAIRKLDELHVALGTEEDSWATAIMLEAIARIENRF